MEPAASQAVCVQQPPFPTPPLMCVLLATLPAPHVPSALITALAASIHSITYQMCATPTAQLGTTRTPAISSALSAIPSALHATYPALAAQPAPPTVRINHSCRALHASLLPPVPLAPTPNTLRMSALPAIHHVQPAPSLSITALAVLLPCSICLTSATPTAPLAIMRIQATASVHSAMSSALPVRFLALTARPAQPMAPSSPSSILRPTPAWPSHPVQVGFLGMFSPMFARPAMYPVRPASAPLTTAPSVSHPSTCSTIYVTQSALPPTMGMLVFVSCATTCARLALALWCPSALVARQLPPIRHSTCLLIKPAMPRAQ